MPRKIEVLFEEYEESHKNPKNIIIHWIFEPLAVWGLLATIHALAFPFENMSLVLVIVLIIYFASLSLRITASLSIIAILFLISIAVLDHLLMTGLLYISTPVFVISWVALIIGHRIEGNWPSVFNNPHLIFIGPAWLMARLYAHFGIRI